MKLRTNIRVIQVLLTLIFLLFSYIPFISTVIIEIPGAVSQNAMNIVFISISIATILGGILVYGIFSARKSIRLIGTGFFSIGILIGYTDAYSLAFGIVLSWIFYESWYLSGNYAQIDQEYDSYSEDSVERIKLNEIFQAQIYSFLFIAWIALSISWGIMLLSSMFFIEIGKNKGFGTLGVTISASLLILLLLSRKIMATKFQ